MFQCDECISAWKAKAYLIQLSEEHIVLSVLLWFWEIPRARAHTHTHTHTHTQTVYWFSEINVCISKQKNVTHL
jgi:hypothetical protein